jgi:hypothetical protein
LEELEMAPASHRIAIVCAALLAGPLYLAASAALGLVVAIPQPVIIEAPAVIAFIVAMVPAAIGGFFVALLPVAAGVALLSMLSSEFPALQRPACWLVAGGGAGPALLLLFGHPPQDGEANAALVATGMACARVARAYLSWDDGAAGAANEGG